MSDLMPELTIARPVDGFVAPLANLRVAIVHPFLISQGGGEKVVEALAQMFPQAELFTLLLDRRSLSPELADRQIHSTFLDRIPGAARRYQHLSPLYDLATSRHKLAGFDIVISSGGPGAKTVRVPPSALHIHYCHSPVRFLWDQYEVWRGRMPRPLRPLFAASVHAQRQRDLDGAYRVDAFVANSDYIGERISQYYARSSTTIYPPVAVNRAPVSAPGDYYLTVGRLVPGKRTELIIAACNALGRKLVVAGGGPELDALRAIAGPTVTVAGRVSDDELTALYQGARAFLFAADEDFGIATVEAQSYGLPAIAFGHGGSLEILASAPGVAESAVLFSEQCVPAICDAIERFEHIEASFDRVAISRRAERFSEEQFVARMTGFVAAQWTKKSMQQRSIGANLSNYLTIKTK